MKLFNILFLFYAYSTLFWCRIVSVFEIAIVVKNERPVGYFKTRIYRMQKKLV